MLKDFYIKYHNNNYSVDFPIDFPLNAKEYALDYLNRVARYKNMTPNREYATYSLYQPPLALKAGTRSLLMRLKRKYEKLKVPASLTFGMTKKCQCKCLHCSADYHMSSKKSELTFEEMKQSLSESVDLGVTNIILVGGEPLLHPNVFKLIDSVDKEKATVIMFTNGEFLTKNNCAKLKAANLHGIFVSLDETDEIKHDSARKRKGLFNQLRVGIQNALEHDLIVGFSTYLTHDKLNEGHFEKIMELAKDWGVQEVTFFDAIPVGRYYEGSDTCTYLFDEDRIKIDQLTRLYRNKKEYPALSPQSTLTSSFGSAFCFAANTQFYLSPTGEMAPCDFTPLTIGSYPEKSIQKLWEDMIASPFYSTRSKVCRMQDPEFRNKTINKIPKDAPLPYPMQDLLNI